MSLRTGPHHHRPPPHPLQSSFLHLDGSSLRDVIFLAKFLRQSPLVCQSSPHSCHRCSSRVVKLVSSRKCRAVEAGLDFGTSLGIKLASTLRDVTRRQFSQTVGHGLSRSLSVVMNGYQSVLRHVTKTSRVRERKRERKRDEEREEREGAQERVRARKSV